MSDLPTSQDSNPAPCTATEPPIIPNAAPTPMEALASTSSATTAHTSSAPETEALLEMIRRGLAPDADPTARANALDVCARIVQAFSPPPVNLAPAAHVPTMPPPFAMPQGLAPPAPASPLAAAVGMLRNLPPEQLFDLAIQRLRAALPQGTTVPESKGIQFQLVPMIPARSKP